jgi:hypothetical protein
LLGPVGQVLGGDQQVDEQRGLRGRPGQRGPPEQVEQAVPQLRDAGEGQRDAEDRPPAPGLVRRLADRRGA